MDWIMKFYCFYLLHQVACHVVIGQPNDCDFPEVYRLDVRVQFNAEKTSSGSSQWNLTANITWDPPAEYGDFEYSVAFTPQVTPEDIKNKDVNAVASQRCEDLPRPPFEICHNTRAFDLVVDEPRIIFGDLLFGYIYRLQIHTRVNGTYAKLMYCTFTLVEPGPQELPHKLLTSPDCVLTTGDFEYCEQQPLPPFASVPRDVIVQVDHLNAILEILWGEPYFVNGNVTEYELVAYRLRIDAPPILDYYAKLSADTFYHNITLVFLDMLETDVNIVRSAVYDIQILANVRLPDWYPGAPQRGNSYSVIVNTTVIHPTTPMPRTTKTEDGNPPMITDPRGDPSSMLYIIIAAVAALVVVACILFFIIYRCSRPAKQPHFDKRVSTHKYTPKEKVEPAAEFRDKEIQHLIDVVLGEIVGSGQFGQVYKATWYHNKALSIKRYSEKRSEPTVTVAVKTTKESLPDDMKAEFLDEIRLMLDIGEHPNILSVLGCRTTEEPFYLITEYMMYGSLKDFLLKSRDPEFILENPIYDLTDFKMLQIAHQITKGMEYLSGTRYFHGDLAARNILLGKDLSVKISDFGLANDIYATGATVLPPENKRPVKWYSPEANLEGKCSTEGDVWSFGVVLYEIYSRGEEPYPDMQAREVITRIRNGYRMEAPELCPDEIYELMCACWQYEPSQRPTFSELLKSIENLLSKTRPQSYFDPMNDDYDHEIMGLPEQMPTYVNDSVKQTP